MALFRKQRRGCDCRSMPTTVVSTTEPRKTSGVGFLTRFLTGTMIVFDNCWDMTTRGVSEINVDLCPTGIDERSLKKGFLVFARDSLDT